MTKVVAVVLALAMIAHLIRPFGLPGLKRRGDVWKIAVLAFAVIVAVAALKSITGS